MQQYNYSYVNRSGARLCRVGRHSPSLVCGRSLVCSTVSLQESAESCTFSLSSFLSESLLIEESLGTNVVGASASISSWSRPTGAMSFKQTVASGPSCNLTWAYEGVAWTSSTSSTKGSYLLVLTRHFNRTGPGLLNHVWTERPMLERREKAEICS